MISNYIQFVWDNKILSFVVLFIEYALMFTIYYQTKFKWVAKAFAPIFVLQDAIVNVIVMSTLFLELPEEWLVTSRLKRWKKLNPQSLLEKMRFCFSWYMCRQLNKYDPDYC